MTEPTMKKRVISKSFKLIDFHVYDKFPQKEETLNTDRDRDTNKKTNTTIQKKTAKFIIQMFGINDKGETCSISVNDYEPFFYVKVHNHWTNREVQLLKQDFLKVLGGYHGNSIVSLELVENNKLYEFSAGKQQKFIKITFTNVMAFNKLKNLWYINDMNGNRVRKNYVFHQCSLELYESNIPPLLRYFHIYNISPSGWVSILSKYTTSIQDTDKNTHCDFEYECSLKAIKPLPQKETRVPYKICSFDIEASSSHGDFPVPIKSYKRLSTNIIDIFKKQIFDQSQSIKLIQRIILSAFGYSKFEDVDLVYPKQKISKETLEVSIQSLMNEPVAHTKKKNISSSKIVSIHELFENMNNDKYYHQENESDGEENETQVEDIVDDNDDMEGEKEMEDTSTLHKKPPPPLRSSKTPKTTILDILQNDDYSRDEKIQCMNELFAKCVEKNIFPELEGDKVTFIGSTFMNYGESETYLNHCLVLGSCDPVDNAVIESVDTEKELLLKWTELIQHESPDIIIGYNIFGFDYEFMFRRSQENYCEHEFLLLSRKKDELCGKSTMIEGKQVFSIENTKVQLASGEYDLRYVKTAGRLQIDMYTYFRRDFNLSSYKLDDVAGQFISDDIKKVQLVENPLVGKVTELYSGNLAGLHIDDFIHIEIIGFTSDYYGDGKKFRVIDIIKNKQVNEVIKGKEQINSYNVIVIEGHHTIDQSKTLKWGMAKDDISPQDIFRLANGSSSDRSLVAKYCIQDCNLVHHLMNKIDVITGYVEMSKICSVPISFLVFRGQGIKLTSYVAKKCREKNTLMPDLEKTGQDDGYEGAIVLPPKCSIYMDNPVACVDYASLYPSAMISQNYSHDSKVWTKEYDLTGKLTKQTGEKDKHGNFIYDNLPEYQYIDTEFDIFKYVRKTPTSKAEKVKSGKKICRWVQLPNNQKSILPSILEELLKARADTRKIIKTEKDPFMQNILDKRQLAYKVTANSLYGQCGARTSTFYEKDVAASTTATGRMMIIYAKRIIEEVYGNSEYETKCHGLVKTMAEYIYGDTDSVFFTFNLKDPVTNENIRGKKALEITIEIAQDAAKLCTEFLKSPMELSYEKTLMPFILLSKKKYVGMLYETDANKGKLKYMGLSLKRRDSCDYLKDTYGGILNILMKENNIQKAIQYLDDSLDHLIKGKVPMDKLAITRALRSDYKNPNQIAHKVLADRIGKRDPGNKPKSGDRIKFVFINNTNTKALLGERIETPEYITENKLKIDYMYYITNQLMKPLQQLFGLALEPILINRNSTTLLKSYKKEIEKLEKEYGMDYEIWMKKKEKYCATKVKTLLFDKFLKIISNERNHLRPMSDFYSIIYT